MTTNVRKWPFLGVNDHKLYDMNDVYVIRCAYYYPCEIFHMVQVNLEYLDSLKLKKNSDPISTNFLIYVYIFLSDLQEFKLMCKNLSQEQVRGSQTWRMYSFINFFFFICFRLRLHLINTTLLATRCSIIKSSAKWFTTRRSMNINKNESTNIMS